MSSEQMECTQCGTRYSAREARDRCEVCGHRLVWMISADKRHVLDAYLPGSCYCSAPEASYLPCPEGECPNNPHTRR